MPNLKVEMQAGLLAVCKCDNQPYVLPRAEDISGLSGNQYLVRNDSKSVIHITNLMIYNVFD